MAKCTKIKGWMVDLANKHNISVDTVMEFYANLIPDRNKGPLRNRTEDFFDLYFEEVRKEPNYGRR